MIVIQRHQSFHTISSVDCFRANIVQTVMRLPIESGAIQDLGLVIPQKYGQTTDQRGTNIAKEPRDHSSPYNSGIVLRPRTRSPAISGKSWAWIVVATTAAIMMCQCLITASSGPVGISAIRTSEAPLPKQARATALIAFRCHGPASPPSKSLYSQMKVMRVTPGVKLPSRRLKMRVEGTNACSTLRASSVEILPEVIGLHGLLTASSDMDSRCRWLEMSSIRR